MSAHGAPVRSRQNIPFKTRRSSTRATPRGLFGSKGPITDHSKSVKSKRAIQTSIAGHLNHRSPKNGIPFMGMWPRMACVGHMATTIRGELAMKTSGRVVVITGGFGPFGQKMGPAPLAHGVSSARLGGTAEDRVGLTQN